MISMKHYLIHEIVFCTSIDTLHGTKIDQIIPINSGWTSSQPNSSTMKVLSGGVGSFNKSLTCQLLLSYISPLSLPFSS